MKKTIANQDSGNKRGGLFQNRVAIISGGLGDIGLAIAGEFARQGAAISIGDMRSPEEARGIMKKLNKHKIPTYYQQVDVSDSKAVGEWVRQSEKALGVADIIIPNAATVTIATFCTIKPEQWARELRINLDGAFYLAQATAMRLLHHKKPGRVVFIGSWAAHSVHTHIVAYGAGKAALRMLCQTMALELAPHQILVNEVAPGYVNGGLSKQSWDRNPEGEEMARTKVPILKLIQPREVALQVVHLCHPENQHMTGSTVLMDGGLSLA